MERDFLFLAGECAVTLKASFGGDGWNHTMAASEFVHAGRGLVRRTNRPRELIRGVIFFADMDDKELERRNLELFRDVWLPCYPDPTALLRMLNRDAVLAECLTAGLALHPVLFPKRPADCAALGFPAVLKLGNVHRGEGKVLLQSPADIPDTLDPCATLEPYFDGESVRVYVVGDQAFGMAVRNDRSWIKNGPGAEAYEYDPDPGLMAHARSVADHFGIDLAGVDYIVGREGQWHFLEINQFPGFSGIEAVEAAAHDHFRAKMLYVANHATG